MWLAVLFTYERCVEIGSSIVKAIHYKYVKSMSKTLFCWLKQYKCDFKDTDMFCNFIVCLKDDMCSYH